MSFSVQKLKEYLKRKPKIKNAKKCFRHDTAEDDLVRETGGSMFLIEVLAFGSLLYRNRLALKVRIDNYRTLLHVAHILEVDIATCIREEIDLVCLIDAVAEGFVVIKGLLGDVTTETLTANEFPASMI